MTSSVLALAEWHQIGFFIEGRGNTEGFYAMKRDFRRVWNYFGAEKMQQVIGLMREQEQTTDRSKKKNRQNSVEL